MESVESNLTNYKVPADTVDQFQNISTFAKNMELKDKTKFNPANETLISKLFSDLMIKYCDSRLEINDVETLLDIVKNYNENYTVKEFKKDENGKIDKILFNGSEYFETLYPDLYSEFSTKYKGNPEIETKKTNINNILLLKDKIFCKIYSVNSGLNTKLSASNLEMQLIQNGEQLIFFDIITSLPNSTLNNYGFTGISTQELITGEVQTTTVRIIILYKELNPDYRKILDSDMVEIAFARDAKIENNQTVFPVESLMLFNKYGAINDSIEKYIRTINDDDFLITDTVELIKINNNEKDNTNTKEKILATRKLYKYQYTNAYLARTAEESEIMKYYYGDNYISNNYGIYKYQKEEIQLFLDKFKETRYYYYRVLLNDSFLSESFYRTYEKLFLIYWSIERFTTEKINMTKDIDLFDLNDIVNFLNSYGLGDLANIINPNGDNKTFYNVEEYAKKIIKNYINLIQNKGSRKGISVIEDIFSINKDELNIFRNVLVKYTNKNDDGNETSSEYDFLKINYDTNNLLEEIANNNSSRKPMRNFLKDKDEYWDADKTPEKELNDRNVNFENTKYIVSEFDIDLVESYYRIRIFFALMEYFFTIKGYNDPNFEDDGEFFESQTTIFKSMVEFKKLYFLYLSNFNAKLNIEARSFKINTTFIEENKDIIETFFNYANENDRDALKKLFLENNDSESNKKLNNNTLIAYIVKMTDLFSNLFLKMFVDENYNNEKGKSYDDYKKAYDGLNNLFIQEKYKKNVNDKETVKVKYILLENSERPLFRNELITEKEIQKNTIIKYLSKLSDIISMDLKLNLAGRDDVLSEFVSQTISYFISYTTQLYNFEYLNKYDSDREAVVIIDQPELTDVQITEIDSFFIDDRLDIDISENTTQEEGGN